MSRVAHNNNNDGATAEPERRLIWFFFAPPNNKDRPKGALAFGGGVQLGVLLEEVERGRFFCSELGGFRNLLHGSRGRHFRQQLNAAVVLEARTGGDEA